MAERRKNKNNKTRSLRKATSKQEKQSSRNIEVTATTTEKSNLPETPWDSKESEKHQ
jgi:hypothetical protein